jgi:hypothetical protein
MAAAIRENGGAITVAIECDVGVFDAHGMVVFRHDDTGELDKTVPWPVRIAGVVVGGDDTKERTRYAPTESGRVLGRGDYVTCMQTCGPDRRMVSLCIWGLADVYNYWSGLDMRSGVGVGFMIWHVAANDDEDEEGGIVGITEGGVRPDGGGRGIFAIATDITTTTDRGLARLLVREAFALGLEPARPVHDKIRVCIVMLGTVSGCAYNESGVWVQQCSLVGPTAATRRHVIQVFVRARVFVSDEMLGDLRRDEAALQGGSRRVAALIENERFPMRRRLR